MSVLDKFLNTFGLGDDSDYDDDDEDVFFDDEEEQPKPPKNKERFKTKQKKEEEPPTSSRPFGGKVSPIRPHSKGGNMEVCVIKPTTVDEAREITETLLEGRTVILNLEGIDLEIAQRIIDFTAGASFAIDGNLQKISTYIFLVTPTNVSISGDLQDLLNSSFDVPSMKTRY